MIVGRPIGAWTLPRGRPSVSALVLAAMVTLGVVVPLLSPYDPNASAGLPLQPPSPPHPFGTDDLARDVFTRVFAAVPVDLGLATAGVVVPMLVGTLVGAVAGMTKRGALRGALLAVIDAVNSFPTLVLMIAIVAMIGPGPIGVVVALWATGWARYARIARARAASIRDSDFLAAATILGYHPTRIMLRHILPNLLATARSYALSDFVLIIISVAGLSFLGLGVRPPGAEWGAMISDGRLFISSAWWMSTFPGLALAITSSAIAFLGSQLDRKDVG